MNLSISNIAWDVGYDKEMYLFLQQLGYSGLEIAPTRIFSELPYERISEAKEWALNLKEKYNLEIPSMQSIWYGHTERIFGSGIERQVLIDYTKKAILFANAIGCKNLVFGNPKNRDTDDIARDLFTAIEFFKEIGDYAAEFHTTIALEPNPIIYNTRFMNRTEQVVEIAYKTNSDGIKINVDLGAMIYNNEDIDYLKKIPEYINHIHVSEPGLKLIERRNDLHKAILEFAQRYFGDVYVSIEMGKQKIEDVRDILEYLMGLSKTI
jgi:sugar phosphate isomerase/epimerase